MQDGKPQYLMLARKSPYKHLAEQFAMYSELEKLANNEKNHVILTPLINEKELPELKVLVIPEANRGLFRNGFLW